MSDLEPNREIAGRYRTVRFIGKGGMGAVYEVEHLHTGQRLAMKVLASRQPELSVERFKREARAASRIQSDHVVRVTDADVAPELEGAPFLVMELLSGSDLERATADGPAPPADVLEWLRQVARALVKAHAAGIVHRDLKPENLFLTRREDGGPLVKILDFGIAKMVGAADAGSLTQSGQFLGTPYYMAPEQADSEAVVTGRVDLYALGLIAFRLLVGKSYWKTGSLPQVLAQILAESMVPPSMRGSTFGAAFDAWFLRSCDRDPSQRFEQAFEQIEALAVALGSAEHARMPPPAEGVPSPSSGPLKTLEGAPTLDASSRELTTVRTRRNRRRWIALGAGAVTVVACAALVRTAGRSSTPSVSVLAAAANLPLPASAAPAPTSVSADIRATPDASAPPMTSAVPSAIPGRVLRPPLPSRRGGDVPPKKDPLEGQY
jgi:serine/threonine-protein kinase